MRLLKDSDIQELLSNNENIIDPRPNIEEYTNKNSEIQASSLDLHVGNIFSPADVAKKPNSPLRSRNEYSLKPGETIVVRTKEKVDLPKNISAIASIPSHVSIDGILATNPGHIDPGYKGFLHLTLINMGKEDWGISSGKPILTLMLFDFDADVAAGYQDRNGIIGDECNNDNLSATLEALSPSFMNYKRQAKKAARNQFWKMIPIGLLIALIIPIVGYIFSLVNQSSNFAMKAKLQTIEKRIDNLEKPKEIKIAEDVVKSTDSYQKLKQQIESAEIGLATLKKAEVIKKSEKLKNDFNQFISGQQGQLQKIKDELDELREMIKATKEGNKHEDNSSISAQD